MAEALRQAIETFGAAPRRPADAAAETPGRERRADILRPVKLFEQSVARWGADLLMVQQGLAHLYEDHAALPDGTIREELARLDEFIEQVDSAVEAERLALEQS